LHLHLTLLLQYKTRKFFQKRKENLSNSKKIQSYLFIGVRSEVQVQVQVQEEDEEED
jgi:hypothetical protein